MKDINREKQSNLSYKLGYLFGIVLWACFTSVVIAATIKLVLWIF